MVVLNAIFYKEYFSFRIKLPFRLARDKPGMNVTAPPRKPHRPTWTSAFHQACQTGSVDDVKRFLNKGVDIDYMDYRTPCPLIIACRTNNVAVVRLLVDAGAKVNQIWAQATAILSTFEYRERAQWTAKDQQEQLETVKHLVTGGANVNQRGPNGLTALMMACDQIHPELVEYLLQSGADPNTRMSAGSTALHVLYMVMGPHRNLREVYSDTWKITNMMIKHGAKMDCVNANGRTPLMVVMRKEVVPGAAFLKYQHGLFCDFPDVDIVKSLVQAGATLFFKDKDGANYLDIAHSAQFKLHTLFHLLPYPTPLPAEVKMELSSVRGYLRALHDMMLIGFVTWAGHGLKFPPHLVRAAYTMIRAGDPVRIYNTDDSAFQNLKAMYPAPIAEEAFLTRVWARKAGLTLFPSLKVQTRATIRNTLTSNLMTSHGGRYRVSILSCVRGFLSDQIIPPRMVEYVVLYEEAMDHFTSHYKGLIKDLFTPESFVTQL